MTLKERKLFIEKSINYYAYIKSNRNRFMIYK